MSTDRHRTLKSGAGRDVSGSPAEELGDQHGRLVLRCLVAAACTYHHLAVALEARRCHDRLREAGGASVEDELDGVDRVTGDAPVEDDRRDVVLVEGEASVESLERRRGHAGDAVLRQRVHPVVEDLLQVVGEQDERGRSGDLPVVVAGHGCLLEEVGAGREPCLGIVRGA